LARQLVGGIVVATLLPVLGGCQKSLAVSALNRCGYPVEARAESVPELSMSWQELRPGQRDEIVAEVESAKQLYVQVRNGKDDPPVEFVVAVADLPKPAKGVDDDVEIVLAGDRCPAVAG
jgi:hypothetical protein